MVEGHWAVIFFGSIQFITQISAYELGLLFGDLRGYVDEDFQLKWIYLG